MHRKALRLTRREFGLGTLALLAGCHMGGDKNKTNALADDNANPKTVGEIALPFGTGPVEVNGVALVTGLQGTGGDCPPSPERDALVSEMLAKGVERPSEVLRDTGTALVLVRGYIRPGAQKGDRFDLEVRVPSQSTATSLFGGWMMETRMSEMAMIGGDIKTGSELAIASGPVLVDPKQESASSESNNITQGRGRVLGGAIAVKSRPLGLVLKPKHQTYSKSHRVGEVLNRRFHTYESGIQRGVAKPKTTEYIELEVHPRYKDNIGRYLAVVKAVALRESATDRAARLAELEAQLQDPLAAAGAALRLEALGDKDAVRILGHGMKSENPRVRFYSAEAMAYLNQPEAAEALGLAARDFPEFRVYALTALSSMDEPQAWQQLRMLLDSPSVETRYGAFRALWAMNENDPLVHGEMMAGQFSYHVLATEGQPLVTLTRSFRPEIVLFGAEQKFKLPVMLEAGNKIVISAKETDETIRVSKVVGGREGVDVRNVPNRVDSVIRAAVELGAMYPDLVQMLQHAKDTRSLEGRMEIDAVPEQGPPRAADDSDTLPVEAAGSPLPDLFARMTPKKKRRGDDEKSDQGEDSDTDEMAAAPEPTTPSWRRWFGGK